MPMTPRAPGTTVNRTATFGGHVNTAQTQPSFPHHFDGSRAPTFVLRAAGGLRRQVQSR
jgi:hypothetical protein